MLGLEITQNNNNNDDDDDVGGVTGSECYRTSRAHSWPLLTNASPHQSHPHHQDTLNSQKLVWGSDVYGGEGWEDDGVGGP